MENQTALSGLPFRIRQEFRWTFSSYNERYHHIPKYWHFLLNHPVYLS